MNISLIQPDIIWDSPTENLRKYDAMLSNQEKNVDLIVFPEMFTTGFSMQPGNSVREDEQSTLRWIKSKSTELETAIAASIIIKEGELFVNRFVYFHPKSGYSYYDKRHLFKMGGEGDHFRAGSHKLILTQGEWKICPLICYDIRFPVWIRNREEYDLLLIVANWPAARQEVWNVLLKARAIENQCFVVGVNRTGTDGENILYSGGSQVIDPKGRILLHLDEKEQTGRLSMNLQELQDFKKKFPVWKDRDIFKADW